RTRATTARRKSSADGPSSLTNAVTSQEDNRMRAPPILTVVIDLPRVGGVAISCSQICSMQFSKSSATTESGSVAAGAERSFVFALTLEAAGPEGAFLLAGRDFAARAGPCWIAASPAFPSAFSKACSTSARSPSSLSKAWLTDLSVYSFWKGCFHSSATAEIFVSASDAERPKL